MSILRTDKAPGPRNLLVALGLVSGALAVAALFIGATHGLVLVVTGTLDEPRLAIQRGHWEWAVIAAAVFLAFLGLIPVRLRRDWKSHGVYAAFVVSLFAEMFGFPLTAYFLSSALGLTVFERQFMSYMYGIGMPVGSLITFIGILLIIFGWREVYRARGQLATGGIYRLIRHPQYLGILLVTGGWLVHWPTIPGLLMWPVLMLLYYRLARREDEYLVEAFGEKYRAYASITAAFVPFRLR